MIDAVVTDEFKMTELGPLPIEWDIIKSREKLLLNDSGVWGDDLNEGEIGIEVLRSTNMQNNQWVFEDIARRRITEEQFRRYWLREGDILITKSSGSRRHIGKAAYVDEAIENRRCIFANFMQRLRFNDDVYPKFAFYFIISETGKNILLSCSTTTTGLRNLQKTDFENIIMPLPPLPKQKKIAYILSIVQTAIEKTEAVIKATRELKKSLMKHLFTYGPVSINEAENVPLKETEIGMVPEEWEMVRLGAVCQKTRQADPTRNPGLKFCYIDVSSISRDFLRIADCTEYSGVNAPSRARKVIRQSDVIFATVRPYLKRIAVVPTEFDGQICSTAFCVIRANPTVAYSHYLFYAVSTGPFVQRVSEHQRGSSYPAVTNKDVLKEFVPLPSVPTQQQIADILTVVDKKIEAEENKKKALEALFKTLLSRLMTGKIRVNNLEVPV